MKNPPIDSSAACRELFQATPNAILFVDEAGRIVLANPACDTLFGYAPESLQGQNVNTLVPEGFSESVRRRAEAATGQQRRPMRQGRELVARHADGCELPVNISFTPLIAEGRHLIACSAARDLRGRSPDSVDARLQSAALQFAASGIVITDPSGTILWVNPAASAITGYSPDELVGQNVRVLKSGEHGEEVYADLWETISSGRTWSGKIVNRRKDGSVYLEEQTIAPVLGDNGSVTHFVAIKQDVTEQQRTQAALAHAHEELAARVIEIEGLNRLLREDKSRMDAEFRLGRQVQRRLLPEAPGGWHDVDLAVSSVPCFEVSGDYHDFIDLPDGDLGLAIGDVSGKGMGAALIMSSAQAALRIAAPTEPDLARLFARLDELLLRTTPRAKFATFFFARFNRREGVLRYVNAGHNPPFVYSRGELTRLEATGPPLGIMGGATFREECIPFDVGSTLFLYSDGFNEAENPDGEEFGMQRWEALVRESADRAASEASGFLTEAIVRFEGGRPPTDDKTLVVFRRAE